ncbi:MULTISPECIES: carboxymuconolactone decarboxylase family protein [Amycolatopsis]|uniref:Carboxymuconolactone decarboxylase family protein n=1 Tax=Amycolatopsis thermalba TaxID=944492 RepID=A0ABY4NYR7_9PSEU|nr:MULTISPECIES: carboxymuconolactone decarboxylase family protein [Amycolatopsis]OXM75173.1 alkylhydroperoxidase [Amycolatopsis sp. KNN50.9b]UQS25234.1 carboxymuconolactone decarboxylase family protein [Amycolatopsis thermalba]
METGRRLRALDPGGAPEKSRELLGGIVERHGSAGEMIRTMAHSPALLQGYLELSRAMKRTKLPRAVCEKLAIAVQEWIGCGACLEAHIEGGRAAGLSDTDIALARQGTATDRRETALVEFAVRVLAEPASRTDDDVAGLRAHGWSERVIAEVVGLVSLNLLTGAFNLVAGIEPATPPR